VKNGRADFHLTLQFQSARSCAAGSGKFCRQPRIDPFFNSTVKYEYLRESEPLQGPESKRTLPALLAVEKQGRFAVHLGHDPHEIRGVVVDLLCPFYVSLVEFPLGPQIDDHELRIVPVFLDQLLSGERRKRMFLSGGDSRRQKKQPEKKRYEMTKS
jgi:hypothetical protein